VTRVAAPAASRVKSFLALLGLIAIPVTYGLVTGWNPLPGISDQISNWLNRPRVLSQPAPTWVIRPADQPSSAAGTGGVVLLAEPGAVEARDVQTGAVRWSRSADWSALAGSPNRGGFVVVLGTKGKGYIVVTPDTGIPVWSDPKATGVWTFADMLLSASCQDSFTCTVAAHSTYSGSLRWQVSVSGTARNFSGANRPLSQMRPLRSLEPQGLAVLPEPAPTLLGFPFDNQVQVIDTGSGRRVHTYRSTDSTLISVADDRVLVSTAEYRDGHCRFAVSARDPATDREVWHKEGYDLGTSGGLGCDQRRNPAGGGGTVAAVSPDGRGTLLRISGGGVAYQTAPGETLVGTDGVVAVVRSADGATLRGVRITGGGEVWHRVAGRGTQVGAISGAVVLTDPGAGQLVVLADSGEVLVDAKSNGTVLGYADRGLVINIGRSLGLLPYGSISS
jgi:outer membrane protein assembly factor BamB